MGVPYLARTSGKLMKYVTKAGSSDQNWVKQSPSWSVYFVYFRIGIFYWNDRNEKCTQGGFQNLNSSNSFVTIFYVYLHFIFSQGLLDIKIPKYSQWFNGLNFQGTQGLYSVGVCVSVILKKFCKKSCGFQKYKIWRVR